MRVASKTSSPPCQSTNLSRREHSGPLPLRHFRRDEKKRDANHDWMVFLTAPNPNPWFSIWPVHKPSTLNTNADEDSTYPRTEGEWEEKVANWEDVKCANRVYAVVLSQIHIQWALLAAVLLCRWATLKDLIWSQLNWKLMVNKLPITRIHSICSAVDIGESVLRFFVIPRTKYSARCWTNECFMGGTQSLHCHIFQWANGPRCVAVDVFGASLVYYH